MQGSAQEKKKKCMSTQKTLKISKKLSPKTSDTVNGLSQHNSPDLWDRGSTYVCYGVHLYITHVYLLILCTRVCKFIVHYILYAYYINSPHIFIPSTYILGTNTAGIDMY